MSIKERGIWLFVWAAAGLSVIAFGSMLTRPAASHAVEARVFEIYTAGARFPRTMLIARAPHSLQTNTLILPGLDGKCHVGDTIDGVETGITLKVDPATCRSPKRPR